MDKGKHLQQMVLANGMPICRRMQIDLLLAPRTKLKSKWIKELNINPITLNLLEENLESILECIDTGVHFLDITPVAQTLRLAINK